MELSRGSTSNARWLVGLTALQREVQAVQAASWVTSEGFVALEAVALRLSIL